MKDLKELLVCGMLIMTALSISEQTEGTDGSREEEGTQIIERIIEGGVPEKILLFMKI